MYRSTRLPWALIPVQLTLRAKHLSFLKTVDLILRCGEYLLDHINISILENTVELIPILAEVRGGHIREFRNIPQIASLTGSWRRLSSGTSYVRCMFLVVCTLITILLGTGSVPKCQISSIRICERFPGAFTDHRI